MSMSSPGFRALRPKRSGVRGLRSGVCLVLLVAVGACASLGLGEEEPEILRIGGEYTGTLSIQGQQLFGSLNIDQDGEYLELHFHFPDVGLQAMGEGRVSPAGFMAEVPYALTCPGEATFEGTQDPRDRSLAGNLSASDCDGTQSGTFRFAPRD